MSGSGPVPDIVLYGDAPAPVDVFRSPGDTLSMRALARQHVTDPVAADTGAIVVITRSIRKDGPAWRQQWFVTDGRVIADPGTGEVRDLADGVLGDITIGQHWRSPFGLTYPVRAVMRPRTWGFPPGRVIRVPEAPGSPPRAGLAWLDRHVYHREPRWRDVNGDWEIGLSPRPAS